MDVQKVYAKVPAIVCKGLCGQSCGPIVMSTPEAEVFHDNGHNLPVLVDHPKHGPATCSHLDENSRCRVYENRPLICRLFGVVRAMKCPHGCKPERYLTDKESDQLLRLIDNGGPKYLSAQESNVT